MSRAGRRAAALGLAAAAGPLLLAAPAAQAHAPIEALGGFYAGALHPVLVPAHILAITALALLLGQRWLAQAEAALPAFAAGLAAGLALAGGGAAAASPPAALAPVAVAAAVGLLVAAAPRLPRAASAALAAACGLAVGLDSAPDAAAGPREAALTLAGTGAGACLALLLVAGVASEAVRPWQRVGVRVAGSWTAAVALLVLALALAGERAGAPGPPGAVSRPSPPAAAPG